MAIENYTIGLVVSAQGITDDQARWITKTLKWTLKALGHGTVTLFVPGINTSKASGYGLPRSLTGKPMPPNVKMVLMPGINGVTRADATLHRASQLATVDEVWCFPGWRQSNRLSKTRAALSFWYGVGGPRGHIYKWVPPWVDGHETVFQPKKKELPWISR
jgi:hypothetical protein